MRKHARMHTHAPQVLTKYALRRPPRQAPAPAPTPGGTLPTPSPPRTSRAPRPLDVQDQQARDARQHLEPLRPAYAHLLDLGAHGYGLAHARQMVADITTVLDRGGWTSSERSMLGRARTTWRRRAAGQDVRYALLGSNTPAPAKGPVRDAIAAARVADAVLGDIRAVLAGEQVPGTGGEGGDDEGGGDGR